MSRGKEKAVSKKKIVDAPQVSAKKKPIPPKEPWKPGQSGNPSGRPKTAPELIAIKNMTEKELIEIGNIVIKGNIQALKDIQKDPDATVIKVMIAAVAVKIISKGDMGALDVLLNRLVGKVKDKLDVNNLNTTPARVIVTMPSNGKEAKA